jgi:hypothetical protein
MPAPVTPKYLIKESEANTPRKGDRYTPGTHMDFNWFCTEHHVWILGFHKNDTPFVQAKNEPGYLQRVCAHGQAIALTIEKNSADTENGLQIAYTLDEMVTRAEGVFARHCLLKVLALHCYIVGHAAAVQIIRTTRTRLRCLQSAGQAPPMQGCSRLF